MTYPITPVAPRERIHGCPDCTHAPKCDVCGDMGTVSEFKTEPLGGTMSTNSWTVKPCPKGCPRPLMFL